MGYPLKSAVEKPLSLKLPIYTPLYKKLRQSAELLVYALIFSIAPFSSRDT